ncbi:MAG: phage tail protein I [Caulobacter sp.]|nr:phage tail protein I [Caulobacter sp.]
MAASPTDLAAFRSLLPPNATAAEKAIEAATARIERVETPLRACWNPDTCPVEDLPWLAWALSIDLWDPTWSESLKRTRIRNAIAIQRRKGTVASVRDTVQSFGGGVALREWFEQDPPGDPYTFALTVTLNDHDGAPPTPAFVDQVMAEVSRTKPARAHFTFTQGLQALARMGLTARGRVATYVRLQAQAAYA